LSLITWDEFVANNAAIQEAGIPPVLATFGDTWTSQLFVLADYYNVEQAVPGFADAYTGNQAKYASTPAALAGFQYLQQGFELGWWQQDFATTRFEQGLSLLANGEVAHYPMLTFALSTIATNFPDQANDIGFFAQPGHRLLRPAGRKRRCQRRDHLDAGWHLHRPDDFAC